jgi:hypothetical protein
VNHGHNSTQIAAGNAGWRSQFRSTFHAGWPRVPELWVLGVNTYGFVRVQVPAKDYEAAKEYLLADAEDAS